MKLHQLSACGKAHCWDCDSHLLVREMPLCNSCLTYRKDNNIQNHQRKKNSEANSLDKWIKKN